MTAKIYRLEVGYRRSPDWAWFLRLAKKMPGYRVEREDGLELHVVETTSVANLEGLYEIIRSWRGWAFIVDGTPATRRGLAELVARRREKTQLPKTPRPEPLSREDKMDRKIAADMARRARPENLEEMGVTRDEYERALLEQLRNQRRRRGPDPKLGF